MPDNQTICAKRKISMTMKIFETASPPKPARYITGRIKSAFTTPIRAYKRLAMNMDARKAAAVLNPLKMPRNPASAFSSGYCARADCEKGNAIEKYKMENKTADMDTQIINVDFLTN